MRNLKRALSLALASVMLLGMMVVGTSAASTSGFADADSITQAEAVDITTGLGIFEGYPDGSFQPATPVTRAQMAVIITKILHNVGGDPSIYEGAGLFTDVPKWAEGYVNMAASMGIIVGRGNGIFDPNATVTTAEAATMLLKALGYYGTGDELGADWKLTVVSKATYLGLYGGLKLDMNAPLTRENVAVLVKETLFAQMVAYNDVRGQYVKTTNRDIVVTNGTKDDYNTLAYNTYGLYKVEGQVIANGYTDESLSATVRSKAQTEVKFTYDTDLNKDGRDEYKEGDKKTFEYETDLHLLGHAVDVYYKLDARKNPEVLIMVDKASLAKVINFNWNSTKLADAANAAGFQKNTILDFVTITKGSNTVSNLDFAVNFDLDVRYKDLASGKQDIANGKKLIVISNSGNYQVDEVIYLDQELDTVAIVDEKNGELEYTLDNYNGLKMNVVLDDVDEDDFVIVTDIGKKGDVMVISAANLVDGDLTRILGVSDTKPTTVKNIVVDGTTYSVSSVDVFYTFDNFTKFADIATIGDVTMVMDYFGAVIGLAKEPAAPNYAYVAQYGFRHTTSGLNTNEDELTALIYFADGTSGVYAVDTSKSNITDDAAFAAALAAAKDDAEAAKKVLNGTGAALHIADGGYKGIYNVTITSAGKADIDKLNTISNSKESYTTTATDLEDAGVKLIKRHSTLVNGNANVKDAGVYTLMNNDTTVYFYVTGSYNDVVNGKTKDTLKVQVITGIDNVVAATNKIGIKDDTITADNTIGSGIRQAFYTAIRRTNVPGVQERAAINTMLVQGVRAKGTDVYYYDNGKYEVEKADGGYVVTYTLYSNKTGEAVRVTYDNEGKYFAKAQDAKDHASSLPDGFYTIDGDNIVAVNTVYDGPAVSNGTKIAKDSDIYYVINDTAWYDDYNNDLFTDNVGIGSIADKAIIVDVCNSGLNTLSKLVRAIRSSDYKGGITLSYTIDEYETLVVFVTSYDPDGTQAPGGSTSTGSARATLSAGQNVGDGLILDVFTSDAGPITVKVQVQARFNNGAWEDYDVEYTSKPTTPVNNSASFTIDWVSESVSGWSYRVVYTVYNSTGAVLGSGTTNIAQAR